MTAQQPSSSGRAYDSPTHFTSLLNFNPDSDIKEEERRDAVLRDDDAFQMSAGATSEQEDQECLFLLKLALSAAGISALSLVACGLSNMLTGYRD